VEGIRVTNTGGDGIYIGPADSHVYADSHAVTVRNVTVFNASRCGLGITGVVGLHVQNIIVSETHGASPESAVDIEPGAVTACHIQANHLLKIICGKIIKVGS